MDLKNKQILFQTGAGSQAFNILSAVRIDTNTTGENFNCVP
jgi:hypothetical protein